jgi:hypothetical protein
MSSVATSWKKAVGLATAAVYGPFFLMAVYAVLFVKCTHCKKAAWTLLPLAPGILPAELGCQFLNVDRLEGWKWGTLAFLLAALTVAGLAWVVRQGPRTRGVGLGLAAVIFSFAAVGLLSVIRS